MIYHGRGSWGCNLQPEKTLTSGVSERDLLCEITDIADYPLGSHSEPIVTLSATGPSAEAEQEIRLCVRQLVSPISFLTCKARKTNGSIMRPQTHIVVTLMCEEPL